MSKLNEIIKKLEDGQPVEKIDLRNNKIGDCGVQKLAQALSKKPDSVTTIYLSDNNITDGGMKYLLPALKNLPSLQKLSLSRNEHIAVGNNLLKLIKFLGASETLDTLYLNGIKIGIDEGAAIKDLIANVKTLKHLSLNGCSIDDNIARVIAEGLNSNENLQDISLLDNNITNEGMKVLAPALKKLASLQGLSLSCKETERDTLAGDELAGLIGFLGSSKTLDALSLDGTKMDIYKGAAICSLLQNTETLKYLSLSKCSITNDIAGMIAGGLKINKSLLQSLDLSGSSITNVEMESLVPALEKLTSLRKLSLSDNKIAGDKLLGLIKFLGASETLDTLYLNGINIGEGTGTAIKNLLINTETLKYLSLDKCSITDDIVKLIAEGLTSNEGLQCMSLKNNRCTSDGARKMLEALKANPTMEYLDFSFEKSREDCDPPINRAKLKKAITALLMERQENAKSKKMQLTEKTEQGQKLEQQEKTKDVLSQVKDEKPMMENIPVETTFEVPLLAAVNDTEDLSAVLGEDNYYPEH